MALLCAPFGADPSAGTARFYGTRDVRFRYVAVADVAEVTVQCVDKPAATNRVISFGGPEDLTQRKALQRFEKAFGRPFTVTSVPEEALEANYANAADPIMRSFSALMLAIARGKPSPGTLAQDFSLQMTTVDDFIRMLRAA